MCISQAKSVDGKRVKNRHKLDDESLIRFGCFLADFSHKLERLWDFFAGANCLIYFINKRHTRLLIVEIKYLVAMSF